MSEPLRLRRELDGCDDQLTVNVVGSGRWLEVVIFNHHTDDVRQWAFINLPAADARRLRDWLCARYPHEENENG